MASEVKTNKLSPSTGVTVTLGDASDVFQLPASAEIDIASGATLDVNGTIDLTGATKTGFPSAGFNTVTAFAASSSGWSPASGTTQIIVEVQSGGGGGGGSSTVQNGADGGGGSFAWKRLTVVDTDTMDVVVGAAGTAGAYQAGGGTGGTSSFTTASGTSFTAITCVGGGGGGGGFGAGTAGIGGVGGAVTSDAASYDFRVDGSNGKADPGTHGGSSFWGLGNVMASTVAVQGSGAVPAGTGYGAGGGGWKQGSASPTPTTGAPGLVVIWEYK